MYTNIITPINESVFYDMKSHVRKWFGQGVSLLLDDFAKFNNIGKDLIEVSPYRIEYEEGFNYTNPIWLETYVSRMDYTSFEIFQVAYQTNQLAAVNTCNVCCYREGGLFEQELSPRMLSVLAGHYISPEKKAELYKITPYEKPTEPIDMRLRLVMEEVK